MNFDILNQESLDVNKIKLIIIIKNNNSLYLPKFLANDFCNTFNKINLKDDINITGYLHNDNLINLLLLKLEKNLNIIELENKITNLIRALDHFNFDNLFIDLNAVNLENTLLYIEKLVSSLSDKFYSYKEKDKNNRKVTFIYDKCPKLSNKFNHILIKDKYINFIKYLANSPANICTPKFLAETSKKYAQKLNIKTIIHNLEDIKKIGMNSFLSVAKGSKEDPYFIELTYNGNSKKEDYIILVGKGITFDSGGISLKPGDGMDEMKYDMCGAATVIASVLAAAEMKLPINIKTLVPTCENLPSGKASKPGDIVKSLEGLTIEILNTDAEGRLILCDALTYAKKFKSKAIIDVATLTGACIIALGHVASGVMGNDQKLINKLLTAGEKSNDKLWQLPLWDEYQEQLKSNFANLANIGGRPAGTITAAKFLSNFTNNTSWAHLDIAGTAWKSGKEKGATGRPLPLLLEFLIEESIKNG